MKRKRESNKNYFNTIYEIISLFVYSKMTYNFVTDPRLKRGHNFGVIYVANTQTEENDHTISNRKAETKAKMMEAEV
jgi:hypothetical protein